MIYYIIEHPSRGVMLGRYWTFVNNQQVMKFTCSYNASRTDGEHFFQLEEAERLSELLRGSYILRVQTQPFKITHLDGRQA